MSLNIFEVTVHAAQYDETLAIILESLLKARNEMNKPSNEADLATRQARFNASVEASIIMLDACLNSSAKDLIYKRARIA